MRTAGDAVSRLVERATVKDSPVLASLGPELRSAARNGSVRALKLKVDESLTALSELQAALSLLASDLASAESDAPAPGGSYDEWWLIKQQFLAERADTNPIEGRRDWLRCYASVLAAWQLDLLPEIANKEPLTPHHGDVDGALLAALARDLRLWRFVSALPSIERLAAVRDAAGNALLSPDIRSRLLVLAGRIHLKYASDAERANACFTEAARLAPHLGLPLCAFAEYEEHARSAALADAVAETSLDRNGGEDDAPSSRVHATRDLYERAIALGEIIGGHVGLGLLFEQDGQWEEADGAYAKAIRVLSQQDFEATRRQFEALLAPVSGNLYVELARVWARSGQLIAALDAVDRALALGVKHEGLFGERVAYRLKGDILIGLNRTTEAATALAEAADLFQRRGEYSMAPALFRQASTLEPDEPRYRFALAFALLRSAETSAGRARKTEALIEARSAWATAFARSTRFTDRDGWKYSIRAAVSRALAKASWNPTLNWEAVCFTEARLVVEPASAWTWADLAGHYLSVDAHRCAVNAVEHSLQFGLDDADALAQAAFVFANIGRYADALALIPVRRKLVDDSWNHFVEGYCHARLGVFDVALDCIGRGMEIPGAREAWVDHAAYFCHFSLGQLDLARQDAEGLVSRLDVNDEENHLPLAAAAWRLGNYEEARRLLAPRLGHPVERVEAAWILGVCHLALGELEDAQRLLRDSLAAANPSQLREFLEVDLPELAVRFSSAPLLSAIRREAESRRDSIGSPGGPIEELFAVRAAGTPFDDPIDAGRVAGLGRLLTSAGLFEAAREAYTQLIGAPAFPEAMRALEALDDIRSSTGEHHAPDPGAP